LRKTKEEAEITRKKIIDSSAKIFSQYGYSAARLEDIAREAHVTRGAIYWHFTNKADILQKLIIERFYIIYEIIESILRENIAPLQKLKKILTTILKSLESNEKLREIIDIIIFKVEVIPEIEYQMKGKRKENKRRIEILHTLIKQAQEAGTVKQELDSYTVATSLNCFFEGITAQWLTDPTLFSITEKAEAMIELFLSGIVTKKNQNKYDVF
jgi:TetR/AcrR family acrAB operon transcriptional repressor